MIDTHEGNVYLAKLAEQAGRYEEMLKFMERVTAAAYAAGVELTVEERHLLSAAYEKVIDARHASWFFVCSNELFEKVCGTDDHVATIHEYRSKIEVELSSICNRILKLLDEHLIPAATSSDSMVLYLKMKGDTQRYMAEFKVAAEQKYAEKAALTAYQAAQDIAVAELAPTHPIRLGLALNFSVLYYGILNSPDRACSLAKQAYNEAMEELDALEEESYPILQSLRENIISWSRIKGDTDHGSTSEQHDDDNE